ncbi:HlyD family type I secretion periplasmic adaptor subunit [Eilatimonas milleporae]|uniref:Membrane fusion protein (MFP) family protein n=1 Tax=Eilatimonas milleporae TaxID=911205 RepID=A0A3M0CTP9_9PROT|nr:HlyD family type I secretion periplasmic adaptor subunit [Eilatimonas milleporae]RMB12447.1 HlyD family secretion protein [Eilatimonas milleporae]
MTDTSIAPRGSTLPTVPDLKGFTEDDLQDWHGGMPVTRERIVRFAKIIGLIVFGFGSIWGATVPLGGAISSQGRVIAEDRNRVVQHLEGGILSDLRVREGDRVEEGQILAILDDTQANARLRSMLVRQAILRVQLARRRAEVADQTSITFPADIRADILEHPRVQETIRSQISEFNALQDLRASEIAILDSRIASEENDIEGRGELVKALQKQVDLYRRELTDFRDLLDKGLVQRTRVFSTERNLVATEAQLAETNLEIQKSRNNIVNLDNEKLLVRLNQLKQAEDLAVELQKALNDADEQVERLLDLSARTEMRSPVDGIVFQISARTLGAVVRPGETLMELFPIDDKLRVEVKLSVKDVDEVEVGQPAEVHFGTLGKEKPLVGEVKYVSSDAVVTEKDPAGHFIAYVDVDPGQDTKQMYPGNMGQVYILTEPKTFFSILAGPFNRVKVNAFNS